MSQKSSAIGPLRHVSTNPIAPKKKKKEVRRSFEERVDELIDNLDGFFAFNPEYIQEGTVQVAVSAKLDEGTYQYAPEEYAENILVSKNPRKGADFYVSDLGGFKKVAGSVGKRCLFSRTYYFWKEEDKYCYELLLGNGEQFQAKKIDDAFARMLCHIGGKALKEGAYWFFFELKDGLYSIGRILCYLDKGGELRVLICMPNSGTILDYSAFEVEIGQPLEADRFYSTRFLSFILRESGNITPNRTISQREMTDIVLK